MNILIIVFAFWDYSYTIDANVTYDNNVFSYSQEYIDDFLNQVRAYRFPFETYDDLISTADLNLLIRNKFFGNRTTTFNIGAKINHFLINHQKDYQKIDFGIRQSLGKYALKIAYQIIPRYLIRYYRNPQGSSADYIGCEVKYQTILTKLSLDLIEGFPIDVEYNRRWDDYITEFDLYDASSHIIALAVENKFSKRVLFKLGYAFKNSQTDTTDISSSPVELVPDGSYYQHSLAGDFIIDTKFLVPTKFKFGYDYAFRTYTTDFSFDSLHFGRQDHRHKFSVNTDLKFLPGMVVNFSYMYYFRNATSEILLTIDNIKDYNKYRLSFGLDFYY